MKKYCSYLLKLRMEGGKRNRERHILRDKKQAEKLLDRYIVSIKNFDISKLCPFIKMCH